MSSDVISAWEAPIAFTGSLIYIFSVVGVFFTNVVLRMSLFCYPIPASLVYDDVKKRKEVRWREWLEGHGCKEMLASSLETPQPCPICLNEMQSCKQELQRENEDSLLSFQQLEESKQQQDQSEGFNLLKYQININLSLATTITTSSNTLSIPPTNSTTSLGSDDVTNNDVSLLQDSKILELMESFDSLGDHNKSNAISVDKVLFSIESDLECQEKSIVTREPEVSITISDHVDDNTAGNPGNTEAAVNDDSTESTPSIDGRDSKLVHFPCLSRHTFHVHCLHDWLEVECSKQQTRYNGLLSHNVQLSCCLCRQSVPLTNGRSSVGFAPAAIPQTLEV